MSYTGNRFHPRSHTIAMDRQLHDEGTQESAGNGDSRPLTRKPGSGLRVPTFWGGFILLAGGGAFPDDSYSDICLYYHLLGEAE